jgi:hypothetical protein
MSNYDKKINTYKKFSDYDHNKIKKLVSIKQTLEDKHNKSKDKSVELSR